MTPPLNAARREQAPAPPAKRVAWYCPHCPTYPKPHGFAQNARAAYSAGSRHFAEMHDDNRPEEPTSAEQPA